MLLVFSFVCWHYRKRYIKSHNNKDNLHFVSFGTPVLWDQFVSTYYLSLVGCSSFVYVCFIFSLPQCDIDCLFPVWELAVLLFVSSTFCVIFTVVFCVLPVPLLLQSYQACGPIIAWPGSSAMWNLTLCPWVCWAPGGSV